jgi:hypothetical protein
LGCGFKAEGGDEVSEFVDGMDFKAFEESVEFWVGILKIKTFNVVVAFGMEGDSFLFAGDDDSGLE